METKTPENQNPKKSEVQKNAKLDPYAYIAGIIDGEGCIQFKKKTRENGRFQYVPFIKISMSDLPVIEFVRSYFPTSQIDVMEREKLTKDNEKYKTMYGVRYSSIKTKEILSHVYQYLRVKKNQATILYDRFQIQEEMETSQNRQDEYKELDEKIKKMKRLHACDYPEPLEIPKVEATPEILSYLAGLFDGEGCFGVYDSEVVRKDRGNRVYKRRDVYFGMCMNQPEGMALAYSIWGGSFIRGKNNTVFVYQVRGPALKNMIEDLLPYLLLLKDRAIECQEAFKNVEIKNGKEVLVKT